MSIPEVPMQVFRAEVVRTEQLTPSLRRIVLGGEGLRRFVSTGVPDEYLRVIVPPEGEQEPVLPSLTADGHIDFATVDLDRLRTYTVRGHDAERGELTIDFVVHEGGVAAAWALRAEVGDVVGVNSPTGLYDPPADIGWQILVADLTGVPALSRILEQSPRDVAQRVVVEVPAGEVRPDLPAHPRAEITWIEGGNGHGPSRVAEVVASLPRPDGAGYVWVAGESKALRGARKHLRHRLQLPASAYKTVGYWIENAEEWRDRYDGLDPDVRAELDALWASDRPAEEIEDDYEARLEKLGL